MALCALGTLSAAPGAMAQNAPAASEAQASGDEGGLQEIVVTAQRRSQSIQDVPISVSAFGQAQMDAQGVRDIDNVARLTPGITFQRSDARNGADSSISIRGIASSAGASTTGVYIDDTPIQI
ncbi:MAG: TonB-dependent receptor plug domain-containing protein, partial [Steroidobacteraceae bacterium]